MSSEAPRNGKAAGPGTGGRVLCIGRSDCLGRAGIQGDLRAVQALGGTASTVVSVVAAQDSNQVFDWVEMPPTIIVRQVEHILHRIGADCIKIGQLHSEEQIDIVFNTLERLVGHDLPIVVAPQMVSVAGEARLSIRAAAALKRRLLPHGRMLSVSALDAAVLTGMDVRDEDAMMAAAGMLLTLGCQAVFVFGGVFGRDHATDVLVTESDVRTFEDGPALYAEMFGVRTAISAAIAASLAQGEEVGVAVDRARAYLKTALPALGLGKPAVPTAPPAGPRALDGEAAGPLPGAT